jgi:hypothetical protein
MQGVMGVAKERAMIQSIARLEQDPRVLVGLRFLYRAPGTVNLVKIEVTEVDENKGRLKVRTVEGREIFEDVESGQLRVGRGRNAGEPLMQLINKHGFDPEPYLQEKEFRTPPSRSLSVNSSPISRGRGLFKDNLGGFRPVGERLSAPRVGQHKAAAEPVENLGIRNGREEWIPVRAQNLVSQADLRNLGAQWESQARPDM